MKKILLPIAIVFCGTTSFAQKDISEKYAATITTKDLKKHLTIIAGDEMEGRETGTEGQRKAAAYIEAQFKMIGLKAPASLKGYQQLFPLFRDSMISSVVKIGDTALQYGTDYYVQASKNDSRKVVAKEIVFVGYGISHKNYDDYAGKDVKGKTVVLFLGEPKQDGKYIVSGTKTSSEFTYPGLEIKTKIALEKGAAAIIIINQAAKTFTANTVNNNSKSRIYFESLPQDNSINSLVLSHEAAKKLLTGWQLDSLISKAKSSKVLNNENLAGVTNSFYLDYKKDKAITNASNVIGVIEGSDKKDEYVFLTGHYDHLGKHDGKIYYGADDDGSGTCAVIEMAEAFAKAKAEGKGPRRTVVCMTVSGEEKGLWGSEYYSDHPIYPLEKTTVDLNTDMVGRIDTERQTDDTMNYVYVIGHDKLSSELQPIIESTNKKYTNLVLDYKFDDPNDQERIYYRSDHYNFARKGVPIFFFYDGMLKADYHKPTDTVDKITWSLYEKRVKMIFHTAWEMANRNDMLKRDIPLPE